MGERMSESSDPTYAEAERAAVERVNARAARYASGANTPADTDAVRREWLALADEADATIQEVEGELIAESNPDHRAELVQVIRTQRAIARLSRNTAAR